MSAEAARDLAGRLLGSPVTVAVEVSSSAGNQVFRVDAADRTVFLKINEAAAVQREVAVLELAGRIGVPVPTIVAADPAGDSAGVPCLVLRRAAGRPCNSDSPQFSALGAKVRLLHEVELAGYGSILTGQDGLCGEDASWTDSVRYRTGGIGPIRDAGLVPPDLLDRAEVAVLARQHLLTAAHGGRLLHGDLHPRHVYVSDGQVTAIIDWAEATSGDPVFDLARVLHATTMERGLPDGFAVLRSFLDSYADAPWLGPEFTESLLLHAVVFILWAMRCELEGGSPWPPWWPAQSAALSAILDDLYRC